MGGMDLKTGRSISERLNAPLEDVLYMPIGQEYIFRRGQRPIVTTRYNITRNVTSCLHKPFCNRHFCHLLAYHFM